MNVEYTGRQFEITPVIRKQIETGLEKLLKTHYPPNTKRAQRAKVNLVRYCDGTPVQA